MTFLDTHKPHESIFFLVGFKLRGTFTKNSRVSLIIQLYFEHGSMI